MISLDDMLDTSAAAKWLNMSPRALLADSTGKHAKIPAFWLNQRVARFHPRTIIAKLAKDAGVSQDIIAASLGLKLQ